MMDFLVQVEATPLATWVRDSGSVWVYPFILFLHTAGLGIVVGMSMAIDLSLLGFAPRMSIKPLDRLFPILWFGFWINAVSGTLLLLADATTKLINPVFYTKMVCVALAVVTMIVIRRRVFGDPDLSAKAVSRFAKVAAALSLCLWLGAITAGRLIAYFGPISGQPNLINRVGN